MSRFLKDSFILCVITLIAGLLLGAVYEITYDARIKQQEETKLKAYKMVYSDAEEFNEIKIDNSIYLDALKDKGITSKNVIIDGIVEALSKDGNVIGYIVNVTSKEGFSGDISFAVGIDINLQVKGVSMLSISETPGLGMKASEDEFLSKYTTTNTGFFVVNKVTDANGTNIDAISGATITSKAVTKGVNAAIIVTNTLVNDTVVDETTKEAE